MPSKESSWKQLIGQRVVYDVVSVAGGVLTLFPEDHVAIKTRQHWEMKLLKKSR